MGTFERIRNLSPAILTIFAVLFILFMVLADADISSITSSQYDLQNAVVGEVNGEEIKYVAFESNYNQALENQRGQNPDQDVEIDQKQIRRQVWSDMVDEVLIYNFAKKLGVTVTNDVVADELLNNPPDYMKQQFVDSLGNFQKAVYLELMTDPEGFYASRAPDMPIEERNEAIAQFRKQVMDIERYIKDTKQRSLLTDAVNTAGSIVSKTFAKRKYKDNNTSASLNYIAFPISLINREDVEVGDAEIQEYYNNNKENFEQEAQRQIKYVALKVKPSERDSNKVKKNISIIQDALSRARTDEERDSIFTQKFNDFLGIKEDFTMANELDPKFSRYLLMWDKGDIKGPVNIEDGTYFFRIDDVRDGANKVVRASHILISTNDNPDSAKKEVNSILKRAKSGEDFASLAMQFSKDPGSGQRGGDLGYFSKGQMVGPFEEAAFSANIGDIVGPIETQFGYHIIKVIDSKSTEYKYSYIQLSPKVTSITKNQIKRDAISIKQQVENGANIDSVASKLGLSAIETAYFNKNRPILTSQYLTDVAFNSELNAVLDPIELENYGIIVAQVTGIKNEGTISLEDKTEEIKNKLINKKILDQLYDNANELFAKIKNKQSLIEATEVDPTLDIKTAQDVRNNGTVPGVGKDWTFTTMAMNAPVGKINKPFIGSTGVYIIQITDRYEPGSEQMETELTQFLEQLKSQQKNNTYYYWFSKQKKDANIVDKRFERYKEY